MELHIASNEGDKSGAIHRAIQASVAEAAQARSEDRSKPQPATLDEPGYHENELAEALKRSVQENRRSEEGRTIADVDSDDSGIDSGNDENIKAAIERSRSAPIRQPMGETDEDDIQTAIELSRRAHEEHQQGLSKSKTEEEIVLEYIKKQSLAEEQLKKSVSANRDQ